MAKKLKNSRKMKSETDIETNKANQLLKKILLSGYQLHDNILLNNFKNITELDVSENNVNYLDLSTLKELQVLQCKGNTLNELTIDGRKLVKLLATHNDLTKISVLEEPCNLSEVDLSFNKFKELPSWLGKCANLQYLSANHNLIARISSNITNNSNNLLHTLQLGNNKLNSLPDFTKEKINLRILCVPCNELKDLPKNLFSSCTELRTLNVSYNNLQTLPEIKNDNSPLENLFASNNLLSTPSLDGVKNLRKLKVVHLAYNNLNSLPGTFIESWTDLEELVISGNKLEKLPEHISLLRNLRVLRLHSNLIKFLPNLSNLSTLEVMDLAHNQLSKVNLQAILPKKVRFLDLSCNQQLQVDSGQLKTFQAERSIRFVDVTGKNRFCLPTTTLFRNNSNSFLPWKLGFSETPGKCPKLWISQLRLPQFCNSEGLFGMFDGQTSNRVMSLLPKIIPTILLDHRREQTNSIEYMRYTLIAAYENIKLGGNALDDCAILCHIVKEKPCHDPQDKVRRSRRYILRVAVIGKSTAFLITKQGPFQLPPSSNRQKVKKKDNYEKSMMQADVFEMTLDSDDEYLIICSRSIWETVCIETMIQEIQKEQNLVLAAKKIQDIAQSFGVEQNISIIILKFQNVESYVDRLISELKENVRKKSNIYSCSSCLHSTVGNNLENNICTYSGRSSPIGQSDQGISELSVSLKNIKTDSKIAEPSTKYQSCGEDDISKVIEEDSDFTENGSILSEEQFKCWEYMLEQNTQLLFDKELNKITNLFIKKENSASSVTLNSNNNSTYFGLMHSAANSKMSSSFPQLIKRDLAENTSCQTKSLASKYFGSAVKVTSKNERDRLTTGEDTNSGYFGSVQHLLPYNYENKFAITHERKVGDESVEYASRMSQYWGVASTEL